MKVEKQHFSLPPLELGEQEWEEEAALFAVHAYETAGPIQTPPGLSEPKGRCVPWSRGQSTRVGGIRAALV